MKFWCWMKIYEDGDENEDEEGEEDEEGKKIFGVCVVML